MEPSAVSREQSVPIPIDGATLSGDLAVPSRPTGIVVFAHGSGSSRLSPRNRYVARVLHETGLATLLLDLLTPIEEQEDAASRLLRFNIALLAERLDDATDWVLQQRPVATLPLGYFGASTGAAAALKAAAARPGIVRAVVSRGGRPDLAAEALPRVQAPTMLIVGGADEGVIELNQRALRQLQAPRQLAIVPDATHLFEEPGALEAVARLASDWFARHLVAPAVIGASSA